VFGPSLTPNLSLLSVRRVNQVLDGQLEVQTKEGETYLIPFSTCVWAAGIAMHPLVSGGWERSL